MGKKDIRFFAEGVSYKPENKKGIRDWLDHIAKAYKYRIGGINYIFCNDAYLLEINKTHLNHDYYTDIITFDNSVEEGVIESDIYISVERVNDNAKKLGTGKEEMLRVMVHGLLHLLGYKDKNPKDKAEMTVRESELVSLYYKTFHVEH